MSQDNTIPIVSLDTYVRLTFKRTLSARRTSKKIVTGRIAKDAVQKMSLLLNELIRDVTRASVKIARNAGRKTIMKNDIDTAVFTLYHPTTYFYFGPRKLDRYQRYFEKYFKKEIAPKKMKSRYTMMEKWDLNFPPARIEKIMRLVSTPEDMRIADDAILLMTVLVDELSDHYLSGAHCFKEKVKETIDPETGFKTMNAGIVSWKDILKTDDDRPHMSISTCKYKRSV